jgi:hypothetical protein
MALLQIATILASRGDVLLLGEAYVRPRLEFCIEGPWRTGCPIGIADQSAVQQRSRQRFIQLTGTAVYSGGSTINMALRFHLH